MTAGKTTDQGATMCNSPSGKIRKAGATSLIRATSKPQVLLIEDDPLVARTVSRLLRHRGVEVTICVRPQDVDQLVEHFDLGIFDIDLPESNGVEIARGVLARGAIAQAIFFSGTCHESDSSRAMELGEFISKREGIGALIDRVFQSCFGDPELASSVRATG